MTADPHTIVLHVPLGQRSYDIEIGTGNLPRLAGFLADRLRLSHVVVITDRNVEQAHAQPAVAEFGQHCGVHLMVVEPGESAKRFEVYQTLCEKLLEAGADRTSVVVALGGGVIGDLAGFVAATFARGIPYVQVPTTLLAQVDSSVGGKVAINLPGAKNMVGAFWQPSGVLIDTDVLRTLPPREFRAGLAEVVKYGVILDAPLFEYLERHAELLVQRDPSALRHVIHRSCQLKADVVARDERETTGLRAVLNYGHTFGHALETLTGYQELLHGEAVAMGMMCAARLARRMRRVDDAFVARQRALLAALGLPVDPPPLDTEQVLAAMARDKKTAHGRLRFVLPTRLGHVELVGDVDPRDVRAALQE